MTTYSIEHLTTDRVSVRIVIEENDKKIKMRRSYVNSQYDRAELTNMLPKDLWQQIKNVWGTKPTISNLPDPSQQTEEDRI